MKEKIMDALNKNQVRIAAGVQLVMCSLAIGSIIKKDLRKLKKKYKVT